MRAFAFIVAFNLIVWALANAALAVQYRTLPFALGCLLAWMLSYHMVKLGERGALPLISGLERFLVKHARGAFVILFLLSYLMLFSTMASPETVQEELVASGRSDFSFWIQAGLFSGFLGGHASFAMMYWLVRHGVIPPPPSLGQRGSGG